MHVLKIYRGVMCHDKNDINIEEELTCHFKTDMKNLMNFYPSSQKSPKFAL